MQATCAGGPHRELCSGTSCSCVFGFGCLSFQLLVWTLLLCSAVRGSVSLEVLSVCVRVPPLEKINGVSTNRKFPPTLVPIAGVLNLSSPLQYTPWFHVLVVMSRSRSVRPPVGR